MLETETVNVGTALEFLDATVKDCGTSHKKLHWSKGIAV